MEKKYAYTTVEDDSLAGQHIALTYKSGKLRHRIEDLNFSRVIGGSCVFNEATETAYCFGGIYEEIGQESDPNTLTVINLFVSHKFRDTMTPTRTFVAPIGVVHPPARVFHCSAFDYDRNSVWIYGGGTIAERSSDKSGNMFNDLWEFQTQTQIWTLHEIQKPLAPKWGQSMVYFDNKLYLYGGIDKKSNRTMWILDLADLNNLRWTSTHIPEMFKPSTTGCGMQLVRHPTIGPLILIIGGGSDNIYRNLGYSVDLKVEQSPKDLYHLRIIVFDPIRKVFQKLKTNKNIPNVSYHSTALLNNNLFLIGGLNHFGENKRAFCKNIIRIDIFHYLSMQYNTNQFGSFYSTLNDIPIEATTQYDNQDINFAFPELKKIISLEFQKIDENERLKYFKQLYDQHSQYPYPASDFTAIYDQFCHNLILHQRIGTNDSELPNFYEIPSCYARDFVCYLYTGMIHESSRFIDFRSFKAFIIFCYKHKLIRLMLLEICSSIEHLKLDDVLYISALSLDGTTPLVDEPQFTILKYILFSVLSKLNPLSTISPFDSENIPNVSLISHYLIPLLDTHPSYPTISISDSSALPQSTVLFDLSLFNAKSTLVCKDHNLTIDYSNFSFDPEVVRATSSHIIIAVIKFSLKPLLNNPNDIIAAIALINSFRKKLTKKLLGAIFNDSMSQIELITKNDFQFKQSLVEFLPSIHHLSVLELCIKLIGNDSTSFLLDKNGKCVKFDHHFSNLYKQFTWIQFDISFSMLNIIVFMIYTQIPPDQITIPLNRKILAKSLLSICGTNPNFLQVSLFQASLKLIKNELINQENLTSKFIIKYFIELFNIGLIKEVASLTNIKEWLYEITGLILKNPQKEIATWYLEQDRRIKSL